MIKCCSLLYMLCCAVFAVCVVSGVMGFGGGTEMVSIRGCQSVYSTYSNVQQIQNLQLASLALTPGPSPIGRGEAVQGRV